MDPREQLLQSLMQDLANFRMPERWDKAKQDQVMKGRTKQADIDAGRAAIAENERAAGEAVTQRGQLQERIRGLQNEIDTASKTARQDDPVNQGIQYTKSIGIPAVGAYIGHNVGGGLGQRAQNAADLRATKRDALAEALRNINKGAPDAKARVGGILDTYDKNGLARVGKSRLQFLTSPVLVGLSYGTQKSSEYVDDPYLKEGLNLAAAAERGGAGGMFLKQAIDTVGPLFQSAEQKAQFEAKAARDAANIAEIEGARRYSSEAGQQAANTPPETAAKPAPKPGTRPALRAQAKEMGLPVTTRTPKAEIEEMLARALKASSKAARKAPKAIVPGAVGYSVYDALRNPAEAADGTTAEPMPQGEAAAIGTGAGAATAGTGVGLNRLANALLKTGPGQIALRGLGRVAGPVGVGLTAYDIGSGVNDLAHLSPPLPDSEGSTMYGFEPQAGSPMQMDSGSMQQDSPSMQNGTSSMQMPPMTEDEMTRGKAWLAQNMPDALGGGGDAAPPNTAPAPGNQTYPLSGQMRDAGADDQQAALNSLASLAGQDPEAAQMLRDYILSQIGGVPAQ